MDAFAKFGAIHDTTVAIFALRAGTQNPSADQAIEWVSSQSRHLEDLLAQHGAILLRGWPIETPRQFEQLCTAFGRELRSYAGGGAPRSVVDGRIYTSTEYSAKESIALHVEATHLATSPSRIFFLCQVPPAESGETPIGDMRRVLGKLDPSLVERFERRGLLHICNLHDGSGFGKSWQATFETDDREEVEHLAQAQGCEFEWRPGGELRTISRVPALRSHPVSGERYWANQAVNWHPANLAPETAIALHRLYRDEVSFPKTVFFGDGTRIADADIHAIRAALDSEETVFNWQCGDVMVLDNCRIGHGRRPFEGERRVLVAMS